MPKEVRPVTSAYIKASTPYPVTSAAASRSAGIWNAADDEVLMAARAGGLNWQPIARLHFPNKTANACRKRHERLVERRQAEDWDAQKLEGLAQEYMAVHREMWEILASRVGEKWTVVEAKCMEKGLKNLQATARASVKKVTTEMNDVAFDEQGTTTDRNSDSGISIGSGAEMEVDERANGPSMHRKFSSWQGSNAMPVLPSQEHSRTRSLPQPLSQLLPLYRPPPPLKTDQLRTSLGPMSANSAMMTYPRRPADFQRYSPDSQNSRGGVSIQSILSPAEPPK